MCNLSVPEANLQLRRNLATAAIESVQNLNLRLDLQTELILCSTDEKKNFKSYLLPKLSTEQPKAKKF